MYGCRSVTSTAGEVLTRKTGLKLKLGNISVSVRAIELVL